MTTSVSASAPGEAIPDRGYRSLPARVLGVIRSPRATLTAVAAAPRSAGVLALTFAVTAACSAALLQTEVGRLALVDQWERTASAFGQTVDDAQYAALEQASENGVAYAVIASLASGPLLAVVLSGVLLVVFNARFGKKAYAQVLAVVAHAGVILALRQVIAAPVNYARETLASPMTMTVFLSMFDEASPLARLFGVIDLFVLWWLAVVAIGMSVVYQRRTRPLLMAFIGAYVVLALLLVIAMAMTGGTV